MSEPGGIAGSIDWGALAPTLVVVMGAFSVLLMESVVARRPGPAQGTSARLGSALALVSAAFLVVATIVAVDAFSSGMSRTPTLVAARFVLDPFAAFVIAGVCSASVVCVLLSLQYLQKFRIQHGEYYALLLLSVAGSTLVVSAVDLLTLFLGLELMALPAVILAGFDQARLIGNEAGIKALFSGAFASALTLMGVAFLYGAAGVTDYAALGEAAVLDTFLGILGFVWIVAGISIRLAAVPFHFSAPDVSEGAPTPVAAFIAAAVRFAVFAALARFVLALSANEIPTVSEIVWALSLLTMVVGSLMAAVQTRLKRLLAYAGVAYTGFGLGAVMVASAPATTALLFLLAGFGVTTLGAFAVTGVLALEGREVDRIEDLSGLAGRRPGLAAALTLFMFSLSGIPGTAGFVGRFMLLVEAVHSDEIVWAVAAALCGVVLLYAFIRIPLAIYAQDRAGDGGTSPAIRSAEGLALWICSAVVLGLGLAPNGLDLPGLDWIAFLDWAASAAGSLR